MDILLKNATVVTMRNKSDILKDSSIGISKGKIIYIGKNRKEHKAKREIDCKNKVIIPGLYNCHTHIPMILLRGYENNRSLHDWLNNAIFPAEGYFRQKSGAIYIGALLAIADMVESGTIAFSDMYFNMLEIAEAVDKSGMKACLCNPVLKNSKNKFVLQDDSSYIEMKKVIEMYAKENKKIRVNAGIHAEYTSIPEVWEQIIDFAQNNNLDMQIHLSETKFEHEGCKNRYHGMTPTQVFDKYRLFELKTTAAHGVWLEDEDMQILKERSVTVVNNPVSNLKLASGVAPVKEMLDFEINVALGTDGMASNNSNDLFEEIKFASLIQKNRCKDTTVLSAYEALKMATVNGALAQRREKESGKLEVGYDADLVVLDFRNPRQMACYDYMDNIAFACTGKDVVLTMCQGNILYENGEHKTIDIERVLYEADRIVNGFKDFNRNRMEGDISEENV